MDLKTTTRCLCIGYHLREEDKKNTPQLHDCLNCLVLPRRSLSIVTAMSSRNVIQHYMRSDTGGLLVWHIRDMLRINMQWCQLKAWNALRGSSNVFPAPKNSLRQSDWGRMMGLHHTVYTECAAKWQLAPRANSWWVIIGLDGGLHVEWSLQNATEVGL